MKKLRIVDVPPGKIPLSIRVQFVGVSVLYDPDIQRFGSEAMEYDSMGDGHIVRIRDLIGALREYGQNDAADFLCHAGAGEKYLWFPKNLCELIES